MKQPARAHASRVKSFTVLQSADLVDGAACTPAGTNQAAHDAQSALGNKGHHGEGSSRGALRGQH